MTSQHLTLLTFVGIVLLSACSSNGSKDSTSVSSVTISGTTDEASTVLVNNLADSDPAPNAFSVTVPVTENDSGADLTLEITAVDGDLNSSSQIIDLTIVK